MTLSRAGDSVPCAFHDSRAPRSTAPDCSVRSPASNVPCCVGQSIPAPRLQEAYGPASWPQPARAGRAPLLPPRSRRPDQAVEAGTHRIRIVTPLQFAEREMHPRHPLVVVHEHVVQRAARRGADQRHRLRQVFLRQHCAEPRGDLAEQQRDRRMAETAADRPVGDVDILVADLRTAEGEHLDAGLPGVRRRQVLAVRAGDLGDRAHHQAGGERQIGRDPRRADEAAGAAGRRGDQPADPAARRRRSRHQGPACRSGRHCAARLRPAPGTAPASPRRADAGRVGEPPADAVEPAAQPLADADDDPASVEQDAAASASLARSASLRPAQALSVVRWLSMERI